MEPSAESLLPIGGYILAGGRSLRMGRDKALIHLAGKPLIERAAQKLRRICADVRILSGDYALATYAPIVSDVHPNCGPIGGIEAALADSTYDWNLFLPVDVPLLPAALLFCWAHDVVKASLKPGIHIFRAGNRPQPGLCLVHKAILPHISSAIQREEFALISAFEEVGREEANGFTVSSPDHLFDQISSRSSGPCQPLTPAQLLVRHLWFLNLNTKEDISLAEVHIAALDSL